MDPIDRILGQDEVIEPSTGFSSRVMRAVREEAERPEPIEFPWSRFLPGLCTSLALMFATFMVLGWTGDPAAADAATQGARTGGIEALVVPGWLESSLARGILWATAALASSGLLVWAVLRLGSPRRTTGF